MSCTEIRATNVGRIVGIGGRDVPRTVAKLTALKLGRALPAGMYADGAGLYLQVTGTGAKSWIYRFTLRGKAREMGIGSLSAVSLARRQGQSQGVS